MPKYEVTLSDGRKFQVESDSVPSEADILSKLSPQSSFVNRETARPDTVTPAPDQSKLLNPPTTVGFLKNLVKGTVEQAKGAGRAISDRNTSRDLMGQAPGGKKIFNAVSNQVKEYAKDAPGTIYRDPASFLEDVAVAAPITEGAVRGIAASGGKIGRVGVGAAKGAIGAGDKGLMKGALKGAAEGFMQKAPPEQAIKGFDRFMPNTGRGVGVRPGGPSTSKLPYNTEMGSPVNPNAGGVLGGTAPNLEEVLTKQLAEEMGAEGQANRVTGVPDTTMTTGGKPGVGEEFYNRPTATAAGPDITLNGPSPTTQEFMAGEAADREAANAAGPATSTIQQPTSATTPDFISQPQPWHSGAEPGSIEAKQAERLHRHEAEQDILYRLLTEGLRK